MKSWILTKIKTLIYILFTKFDIAEKACDIDMMRSVNEKIKNIIKDEKLYVDIIDMNEAMIMAHSGRIDSAVNYVKGNRYISDMHKNKILERIEAISNKQYIL